MSRALVGLLALAGIGVGASSTRTARADAAVVGVSDRHTFGRWAWADVPRVSIGIGTSLHLLPLEGATLFTGAKGSGTSTSTSALDGTHLVAETFDLRPRVFLGGPFYVGPNFMIGPAFRRGAPTVATTVRAGSAGVFFEGGAVLGVELRPGRGPLTLYGELLGGLRLATFTAHDETPGVDPAHASGTAQLTQGLLTPRIGFDAWTNPYGTLGGWVGVDALHRSAWSVGFAMTLHFAPFDSGAS